MKTGNLFVGSQIDCKNFVRTIGRWYVYILRRPDGRPFYVGKGKLDRVFQHENEARHPNDYRSNPFKLNVIRKIARSGKALVYEIDSIFKDESEALNREMLLISGLKRLHEGGPLTNLDPGGGSPSGVAPLSKKRHTATLGGEPKNNPSRATLNRFVLNIAPMRSVILKPMDQFIARPSIRYPNKSMAPTIRQAAALIASAAANGVSMDAPCSIPRKVTIDGVAGLVENGVACDIITSGLGTVAPSQNPCNETFELEADQIRLAIGLVGRRKCVDLGVVSFEAA
jgi:hypothetical protein